MKLYEKNYKTILGGCFRNKIKRKNRLDLRKTKTKPKAILFNR